jgi:hypothetical protein
MGKKYDMERSSSYCKVELKTYDKGISLTKKAMRAIERRLERNPLLPKWDILIRPA